MNLPVPLLAVLLPVMAAPLIALTGRRPNLREAVTMVTGLTTFLLVLSLLPLVQGGARPGFELTTVLPGLVLALEVEPLGLVFGLVASGLWIVTSL